MFYFYFLIVLLFPILSVATTETTTQAITQKAKAKTQTNKQGTTQKKSQYIAKIKTEPTTQQRTQREIQANTQRETQVKTKGLSWFTAQNNSTQKWAIMPSYLHNSTYGHIIGGRFFIYPTNDIGYYTSLSSMTTYDTQSDTTDTKSYSTVFKYKYWYETGNNFNFVFSYNGFAEPYYGEGYLTKVLDRIDIPVHLLLIELEYVFKISNYLYGGYFIRLNHRKEKGGGVIKFPWELFVSGGAILRYDSRNDYFNSTQGEYYQLRSWVVSNRPSPVFLDADIRLFFSPLDTIVLALRGKLGLTFRTSASYLSKFSLGGSYLLRGYKLNRFRGENYYLAQAEIRFTPWKYLTLVSFTDIGMANDVLSFDPRYAIGGGVRIGFPPNGDNKIRIEYSLGEDQYNIIVSFNHPF